eukprot:2740081-Pleurochrysis_carterae.AAC.1
MREDHRLQREEDLARAEALRAEELGLTAKATSMHNAPAPTASSARSPKISPTPSDGAMVKELERVE